MQRGEKNVLTTGFTLYYPKMLLIKTECVSVFEFRGERERKRE